MHAQIEEYDKKCDMILKEEREKNLAKPPTNEDDLKTSQVSIDIENKNENDIAVVTNENEEKQSSLKEDVSCLLYTSPSPRDQA